MIFPYESPQKKKESYARQYSVERFCFHGEKSWKD
jgi:hypothetical protein